MASQQTRNELGRLLANTLHMWKLGHREDRASGILPDDDITIELTDTGFVITAFQQKSKPKRQVKRLTDE